MMNNDYQNSLQESGYLALDKRFDNCMQRSLGINTGLSLYSPITCLSIEPKQIEN